MLLYLKLIRNPQFAYGEFLPIHNYGRQDPPIFLQLSDALCPEEDTLPQKVQNK
jgi:hypothetical protein